MLNFTKVFYEATKQPTSESYQNSLQTLWETGIEVLQRLYQQQTNDVIQACYEVSARFCLHVVCVVYGVHWFLEKPNTIDKAYITATALMLEGQWNQLTVLKQTFLNESKKQNIDGLSILATTAHLLFEKQWIDQKKLTSINKILGGSTLSTLNSKTLELCNLAAISTLSLKKDDLPAFEKLNTTEITQLIFHLNTYIGCPRVWDASIQFN